MAASIGATAAKTVHQITGLTVGETQCVLTVHDRTGGIAKVVFSMDLSNHFKTSAFAILINEIQATYPTGPRGSNPFKVGSALAVTESQKFHLKS